VALVREGTIDQRPPLFDEVSANWSELRRLFGPKTDEAKGEWRKLHNEELHDLYSLSSIIRIIKS
jgi:hypothetical protein